MDFRVIMRISKDITVFARSGVQGEEREPSYRDVQGLSVVLIGICKVSLGFHRVLWGVDRFPSISISCIKEPPNPKP